MTSKDLLRFLPAVVHGRVREFRHLVWSGRRSRARASARPIAAIESDDPLVWELKLFNAGSCSVPYLAKGFNQTIRYAADYGKAVGNWSSSISPTASSSYQLKEIEAASQPAIVTQGVTVFMVVVQGKPYLQQVQRARAKPSS